MNIRETTVSKLQQLPEPLLQAVSDFIDFIVLNYQAHYKNGGQDSTHLVHLDDEASTIGERWEKWFAEVDRLEISLIEPINDYQKGLLNKYRQQGLEL